MAFLEDLQVEVQTWIDMGDQIVIGGDVNESVFHLSIQSLFEHFNMSNMIFDKHDSTNAPKTFFRSSEGRIIDGFWGTPGVEVTRCGYLGPGNFPGDHSLLWTDITFVSALGQDPPLPIRSQT